MTVVFQLQEGFDGSQLLNFMTVLSCLVFLLIYFLSVCKNVYMFFFLQNMI